MGGEEMMRLSTQLTELESEPTWQGSKLDEDRLGVCSRLASQLETLSANALEWGVKREVPGSMDVFEQANCGLERIGSLLSPAPPACASLNDPVPHLWSCFACLTAKSIMPHGFLDKVKQP